MLKSLHHWKVYYDEGEENDCRSRYTQRNELCHAENDSECILERKKAPSTYDGICTLLDGVPRGSEIALEATSPALNIYSQLEAMGYKPHPANSRKVKVIAESKLKSDKADSETLARLLMMNSLPEAYVPDEHIQKFRKLTRTRRSFKSMETKCKNSIHAELIRNRIVIDKPFPLAGMRELERPATGRLCPAGQRLELWYCNNNLHDKRFNFYWGMHVWTAPSTRQIAPCQGVGWR